MPKFGYAAKDLEGIDHKGEVEAVDVHQAANLLRRKKLVIIYLKEEKENQGRFFDRVFNRVSFDDVAVTTRQLATMIQSGLVLSESLDLLEEQQTNKRFKQVLREISSDVKGGLDFAGALEKHPDVFPPLYSKLIKAGQISGKLDVVLLQLATNLEKEREFRNKVQGAMIYPAVVVSMMVVVMLIMVFFVMPKLLALYTESNIELPLPTKIMIWVTNFMIGFWWLILLLIGLAVLTFNRYLSTPGGRIAVDTLLLKLPAVGRIINLVILTNFSRTFALLISSGLSILESIKIVSDITGNAVYKNGLNLAYQSVERGLPFSGQLLNLPVFPKLVGQMARTGEETGKLDEVMFKLADYYEAESDNSLKSITTIIEPVVLIILGIGVGFLVISIILPIYQLTTNIK